MKTELKRYAWILAVVSLVVCGFIDRSWFGPVMMLAIFLMCAAGAEEDVW